MDEIKRTERLFVSPQVYKALFESQNGEKVLQELLAIFYDADLFAAENTQMTSYRLGQRDVVKHILQKMAKGNQPVEEDNNG